jgi:hypothetical protein
VSGPSFVVVSGSMITANTNGYESIGPASFVYSMGNNHLFGNGGSIGSLLAMSLQ